MTQEDNTYDIEPRRSPLLQNTPQDTPPTPPENPSTPPPDSDPSTIPPVPPDSEIPPPPPGFVPPVCIVEGPDEIVPDADENLAAQEAAKDAEAHRTVAILGYLVFLLPLLFAPNSRFARYHANQALLAFITGAALAVFHTFYRLIETYGPHIEILSVPIGVLWMLAFILQCIWLVIWLVLMGTGMNYAAGGEMQPLPIIGATLLIHTDPEPITEESSHAI